MKTKLSSKFWAVLVMFGLMGQIAWVVENMYLNVFIYKMFNASAGDISAMVAASAVSAALTTLFMGALSDRLGKRKLFMCGGYIAWGISILGFALLRMDTLSAVVSGTVSAAALGVGLTIFLDCLMTFFGSTANDAAYNAWLTDSTDSTNRGAAEGVNAMMPLVAILAVFGGFMAFDLDKEDSWVWIFCIIGGVTLLIGVLGIFLIKDVPAETKGSGFWKNVVYGFLPGTVKANPGLYRFLAGFVLFNISIQIFMPYLILYYEVSLAMTNYVLVMAPAIVIASAVTAFWGRVYDKKGFSLSGWISLLWLCIGYVFLFFCTGTGAVFVGSLFMMCGYLSGMAVFGAAIRDSIPSGYAGSFQGVRIFAQVLLPGVIGPYIGKLVLANAETVANSDGTSSFIPNRGIFLAALACAVLLCALMPFIAKKKKRRTVSLETPYIPAEWEIPWNEYPRPQLRRENWTCLNGKWTFAVRNGEAEVSLGEINVPYPPESDLSGVKYTHKKGDTLVYTRSFVLDAPDKGERTILHFGAVDQQATVYVNGKAAGVHVGGYLPFDIDITDLAVTGENTLTVEAVDELNRDLAWGKQSEKPGGMWYTAVSGIWQTVWLERVPSDYIRALRVNAGLVSVEIDVDGGAYEKELTVVYGNRAERYTFTGSRFTFCPGEIMLWSPETPNVYRFTLSAGEDLVESYFAMRQISLEKRGDRSFICLNGSPYFFNGLLDQGYFSDGIYLPGSPLGFKEDIQRMKALGFNMLRKHIKIEPAIFYYYCDTLGMAVFQDMVNSGGYSFVTDTALPTLGLKRGIKHGASLIRRKIFEADCRDTVCLLRDHPCICGYTIFNEGWGQFDSDEFYRGLKPLDPEKVWDTASGWFKTDCTDVVSEHVYFKKLKLRPDPEKPLVLSEFGGYSCKIEGHSFNPDDTYGYRFYTDREKFEADLIKLYTDEVIPAITDSGLNAAVLTQVSDVEDETNGLLTYDRVICKVDAEKMRETSNAVFGAFEITASRAFTENKR